MLQNVDRTRTDYLKTRVSRVIIGKNKLSGGLPLNSPPHMTVNIMGSE